MKGATWFNLTAIVGADQIATLWDRADEGDGNADKVAVALTCWSDKHREKAPMCIACDSGMGPLDLCTYVVARSHADADGAIVVAFCHECAPGNPQAVQAAVTQGLRRRGVNAISLPDAGNA
jgi:hypothetical protein